MNLHPHPAPARAPASGSSLRWAALCEAGLVVAMLAGIEAEPPDRAVRNLPAQLRDAEGWRRDLADGAIADLAAVMEPGLAALLAINARGSDCRAAAQALWREFTTARAAIIALLPPAGALGPMRSA